MLNRCPGAAVTRDQNRTRNDKCAARDRENVDAPAPLSDHRVWSFGLSSLWGSGGGDFRWCQKSLSGGLSRFIWLLRRQGNMFIHPQQRRRYKTLRLVSASRRQLLVNQTNCSFVTVRCPFLSPAPGTANANWLHRRLGSYFIPA